MSTILKNLMRKAGLEVSAGDAMSAQDMATARDYAYHKGLTHEQFACGLAHNADDVHAVFGPLDPAVLAERQRLEQERLEAEQERLAAEQEQQRVEAERLAAEQEQQRLEADRLEAEQEQQRLEQERLEAERLEQEAAEGQGTDAAGQDQGEGKDDEDVAADTESKE